MKFIILLYNQLRRAITPARRSWFSRLNRIYISMQQHMWDKPNVLQRVSPRAESSIKHPKAGYTLSIAQSKLPLGGWCNPSRMSNIRWIKRCNHQHETNFLAIASLNMHKKDNLDKQFEYSWVIHWIISRETQDSLDCLYQGNTVKQHILWVHIFINH